MHCPEAALPIVSLLGIVRSEGGQLNNGSTLLHYDLETNVYDLSNKASVTFTVSIYFRNGNRWTNFPVLARQSRIFIAGRIFGITTSTPRLAIGVDDVYFIPTIGSTLTAPVTPTSSAGKQKQADRWNSRANPVTPIKRPRMLNASSDSQPQDETCPSTETHLPIESGTCDETFLNDTTTNKLTHLDDGSSADTILRGRPPKRSRKFSKVD
ncbi:uncharacterized protein N7473_001705 [Penicillium subrubescens]|uniref:uncharacterized protein n=1 Tax=Penicillium subrubescens TaxID=1316194 RepID=UPI00254580F8|nr:uncharacterized protein N7473_001705 [Penicillium subrubescens]KAJ5904789.1 hypothetical protein N7473_001705 [Penicillium subrubescens]